METTTTNINDQKENIRREAILHYGLYIMSFSTNKAGNFIKLDSAQKSAFKLGVMSYNDSDKPFEVIKELNQYFIMGKQSAREKLVKQRNDICTV